MNKFTKLVALFCLILMTVQTSFALTPGSPQLSFTFDIVDGKGVVNGKVTAPKNDNAWTALPEDTKIDIRVVRSCYALSENNIEVVAFEGLAPGEERSFVDDVEPAWQYGYSYTYNGFASIDGNEGYQGFGSVKPGVDFSFAYGSVKAESKEADGAFVVEISALVPDKDNSYPAQPLDVEMTALEFYRIIDESTDEMELINTVESPVKGETYVYTDKSPKINSKNTYLVKCLTQFGMAQSETETFVGLDVPTAPWPVNGERLEDGGYKISWEAPTTGYNYGNIDPEATFYNIYRVWGNEEDQREQIATGVKETYYVDYGEGMTRPRAVAYMVEAANDLGVGGSNTSSYYYDVLIGPAETVPFVESFDGGAEHPWTFENSSYYASFSVSDKAVFDYPYVEVNPVSGSGLIYADYCLSYVPAGSTASMTSYKIDVAQCSRPVLSFYAYMIPEGGVNITPQIGVGGVFIDLETINIADCTEAGWRQFMIPLELEEGVSEIELKFLTACESGAKAAILDEISIVDYKSVGALEVEYNSEECSASISWSDPSTEYAVVTGYEGVVDGENIGAVEMPWVFKAEDYNLSQNVSVIAVYGEIKALPSDPVAVSVPRPPFTEFTLDDHVFTIVQDTPLGVNEVYVKQYLGANALYKTPELVNYDGVAYTVTGIGTSAYKENSAIVSVNIPNTIREVGEDAFYGCENLAAVSFGTGLETISARAFMNCSSLAIVSFTSEVVPAVAEDAFSGIASPCVGKCPEGTDGAYSAVPGLAPISFSDTGIDGMSDCDFVVTEYFNFSGVKVPLPEKGNLMIVRRVAADGTTSVSREIVR